MWRETSYMSNEHGEPGKPLLGGMSMSEATAPEPDPERPLTLEEATAVIAAEIPLLTREVAGVRRALDAAKLSPHRQLSDAMLLEALNRINESQWVVMNADEHVKTAAQVQTFNELRCAALADALAPAVPEAPVRRSHRKPTARERRHLRLESGTGAAIPGLAAAGTTLRHAVTAKHLAMLAATPPAAAAVAVAAVVALGPVHTAEYKTTFVPSQPSATAPSHAPRLPAARLIDVTGPQPVLRAHKTYVKPPVLVVTPEPAPAPVVTQPPPPQGTSWSGTSRTSQTYPSSQPSQAPDYRAQGRHASQWSGEGDSGYQGRHGGSQGAGWQGGRQQDASWQSGGSQGGWQGGGQGNLGGH